MRRAHCFSGSYSRCVPQRDGPRMHSGYKSQRFRAHAGDIDNTPVCVFACPRVAAEAHAAQRVARKKARRAARKKASAEAAAAMADATATAKCAPDSVALCSRVVKSENSHCAQLNLRFHHCSAPPPPPASPLSPQPPSPSTSPPYPPPQPPPPLLASPRLPTSVVSSIDGFPVTNPRRCHPWEGDLSIARLGLRLQRDRWPRVGTRCELW